MSLARTYPGDRFLPLTRPYAALQEWETPPIDKARRTKKRLAWTKYALGFAGRFVLNKCRLLPRL